MVKMTKPLLAALAILFVLSTNAWAVDPPPIDPSNPDPIPVDGGASLLLAAGASYGLRKLRQRKAKAAVSE